MPKGSMHAKATLALAALSGWAAFQFGHTSLEVTALSGGALAGLLITPDLDLDQGCISNEIIRRAAGRPVERAWAFFWRPYGRMMPHRSQLSHLPVVGTLIRLAYLALIPFVIWLYLSGGILPRAAPPTWTAWALSGLILADTLHYLMDRLLR